MSLISLHFFQRYQEKLDKAIKDYVASHSATSITNQEDVSITNPTDGQLLKYSASLQKWINGNGGGGSATTLEELTDVDITDVQNGQVVKWDATNQKWVNGAGGGGGTVDHLNDIGDVDITSVANGQTLIYDDTTNKWKNGSPQVANISDVQDINITGATNGQALVYDGSTNKWKNGAPSISNINNIGDVNISNPTNGQGLVYNSATSKWVNGDVATSLVKLGIAYTTCSTAAATTTKQVTVTDYNLTSNSIIVVKFTYAVPASAKLQINSNAAKNIYYRGSAISATTIRAGDTATMIYDGTQFHLLAVDSEITGVSTKILTQTLIAGSTSVSFTDAVISSSSLLSVYTSVAGLNYTSISILSTTVTIEYPAQASNMTVTLEIKNV